MLLLYLAPQFGGGGEEHVAAGVERRLDGVLYDADDEADAHGLHGYVVADAEERAGHRHEQQRAAGHARRATGTQRGDDAQQEGRAERHLDAHRMGDGQCHHGDGDGSAAHVDGSTQRNADGVEVLFDAEPLAERHVDGDVGCRRPREEGVQSAHTQTGEQQRIGVAARQQKREQRIEDERLGRHAAHQEEQQVAVGGEDVEAVLRDGIEDQTHDAERCKLDDPAYHLRDDLGTVVYGGDGGFAGFQLQGEAHDDRPEQDGDIVGMSQSGHGVLHHAGEQVGEYLGQRPDRLALCSLAQLQRDGKEKAARHGADGCHDGAQHVADDDRAKARAHAAAGLSDAGGYEHRYQDGGDGLQGAYKDLSEHADDLPLREQQAKQHAYAETYEDA